VDSDIYVKDGVTLEISSGAVILFEGPYEIVIEGTLIANGTADSRITFTSAVHDPVNDFTTHESSWKGITFNNTVSTNDSSYVRYCVLEYAKSINESTGSLSNYQGGALFINNFSKITVENNIFQYNTAREGAAIALINCQPQINNNLFYQNYSRYNGSVACFTNSYPYFYNNTATDNVITQPDMLRQSGAVFNFRSKPFLVNNIIVDSPAGLIVQAYYAKELFTFNNDIQGIGDFNGNIDKDPLFDPESVFSGMTLKSSPCIDSGTDMNLTQPELDIYGNSRIINGKIDIGAYENAYVNGISEIPSSISMLKVYPNPANPAATISFESKNEIPVTIFIYGIKGDIIEKISVKYVVRGTNNIRLPLEKFGSGMYVVKAVSDGINASAKLLILK
jgi:hypothetical protein